MPATRAIILAAGVGRRLGDIPGHHGGPKILLDFDGATLLDRHLARLAAVGVERVSIVVGHDAARVTAAAARHPRGMTVTTIDNPHFHEGSVVSLDAAHDDLTAGETVLLMDGDVLYDDRMLARLTASAHANTLLMDRTIEPGDEPVKLCLRNGRIVDFAKLPTAPHDAHGESVGFFRFSPAAAAELARRARRTITDGRRAAEYEEPLRDMIIAAAPDLFGYEDITGLPWTEIDFPEDIARARAMLPALAAEVAA